MRLRTSPWGYGRAIYQKLSDGRIVVYAHLESMAEPMAARVKAAQAEAGRYTTDTWLKENEIPVRRGMIIAASGDTGAGFPHLHLELRSADNVPLNLLSSGLSVPDGIPPTIQRIALVPLDVNSTVNGGHAPLAVTAGWRERSGRFEVAEPVVIHGRIGVSIRSYDRADAAQNKLAPYRHDLTIDGTPVFSAKYDRVSLADVHQVNLDRSRLRAVDGAWEKGYFNLFRRAGNRLGFYEATGRGELLYRPDETGETDDGIRLDKGEHRVEIISADVVGNRSTARLILRANASPHITAIRLIETNGGGRFIEANLSDIDDDWLEVELFRSADGKDWNREWLQRIRAGAGPFTWELPPGKDHHWKLSVADTAGSTAMRTFAVDLEAGNGSPELSLTRSVFTSFVNLTIRATKPLDGPPRILVNSGRLRLAPAELRQIGAKEYIATVPLGRIVPDPSVNSPEINIAIAATSAGESLHVETVLSGIRAEPGTAAEVSLAAGEVLLGFREDSLYEPLFPQAEPVAPALPAELVPTGIAYNISPSATSFDRPVRVSLRKPANVDPGKLAVYIQNDKEKWVFAGNEADSAAAYVGAQVRQLGRFGLLLDETPPIVDSVQPPSGDLVESRRPLLSATVADSGSGISREEQVALLLDGRQLISIYDPEANLVTHEPSEDLSPGEHELVVIVRDNCDNEARKRSVFRVRRR